MFAPVLAPLLALDVLVLGLWCVAAALAIALIMDKLSSILAGVPWAGGFLSGAVRSMAKAVSSAAGTLEGGIDHLIGGAWHTMARYFDKWLSQLVVHSAIILHLAELVGSGIYSVTGLRAAVRTLEHGWIGLEHGVKLLEREWHGIDRRLRKIEREIGAGIGNDVRLSVRKLEKWKTGAEAQLKADEKAITQTLPADLTQLEDFIKAIPGTRYLDWAAGVVVAAVGIDALNFLRCREWGNLFRKWGCGLGTLLDSLLGLVVSSIVLESVCQFLGVLEAAFGAVIGPIVHLLNEVPLGDCEQMPASWAQLNVAPGPLPPAQTLGQLPQ